MYDLIIIGGGPAGVSAAIYALRSRLKTLLLEKLGIGGQVAVTDLIENYPGFPRISGAELAQKLREQVKNLNLEIRLEEVKEVRVKGKEIITENNSYKTKTVIIASGARPRELGIKGEREFRGKGVSYCATCDGFFFRHKEIALVGGGDTAVKEAIYLARMVKKIHLIHRRERLRAEKILQEQVLRHPRIQFFWDSQLEEIRGGKEVESAFIRNLRSKDLKEIPLAGVFIFIGIKPNTGFIQLEKDETGFIKTNEKMETSLPGIFAAGDCRLSPLRQISTAIADGALAATSAQEYLARQEGKEYPARRVK